MIIKVDRVPEILHWGAKIAQIDPDLMLSTERPISQARLDVDVPLSLCLSWVVVTLMRLGLKDIAMAKTGLPCSQPHP